MKTTNTPGPWHVGIKQAEQIVYNDKGWAVANATVYHGKEDLAEVKANARLIAACPDLLAACEQLVAWMDSGLTPNEQDHGLLVDGARKARAALAKARQ